MTLESHRDHLVCAVRDSMGRERPGVHVSSLIHNIEVSLSMKPAAPFTDGYLYAIVGLAWEDWVAKTLGTSHYIWQLQLEKDGICCTLDGLDTEDGAVIECKATWASSNKDIRDVWRYMAQVKAYCYAADTYTARMYVLYVNGAGRPPKPEISVYELQFTDQELEENWSMLLDACGSLTIVASGSNRGWITGGNIR